MTVEHVISEMAAYSYCLYCKGHEFCRKLDQRATGNEAELSNDNIFASSQPAL